ncbi:Putative peptidase C15, pyroglutamyl peptidase I [Septoria linicola]|uniref:Peptidase C15, pyroglutamyl peptidase I n=1 Tax=Septoria linicola TaxID=215465 RepID=A0A9Q9B3G7_9PEZI|nr:putative peptidase C15, pyroglutamyl peptidase I [Septoria linicola]USW56541.1 Putative peptidase C15, pyroglutamyl peptidase I [Septoria linicola]
MAPSFQQPLGKPNGEADILEPETHQKSKEVTILVTGFGPFQEKYPVNPSFEIARRLPERLPASSPKHTAVRIIHYGTPIRVAFDEVRELVPKLHSDYEGTVDVILHIGMASGREYYCIERYGHRDGYGKNKDLDGKVPAEDEGSTIFSDCPATMTTSLKYDDVLLNWQTNVLGIPEDRPGCGAELQESHDPGHYLCDYIYFNSLAYTGRKSGVMEETGNAARPALFMHVPAESDGNMIEKGTAVAVELCRAIADSFVEL